ncbi:TniB family NTP-binding protein [Nocardia salmonicida]|uniref:TniB family NTP-binding protein n=1 Tax=Nocardia salmonicida TaxID=53431 RepID=UPI0037AECAC2
MAVIYSLAEWQQWAARDVVEPVWLTPDAIAALLPADKDRYDQKRIQWLGADFVLATHDTATLFQMSKILLAKNAFSTVTARRGLAISGLATLGKSTTAMLIGKRHERQTRLRHNRNDPNFAPVVYIVVQPAATPKMTMLTFCHFLGLVPRPRATAQELGEQVVRVLKDLRTSLVIVDEVHNLHTNRSNGSEAASALKVFSERIDATFIYAGLDLLRTDLFDGPFGRQIKGRMIVHEMSPYTNGLRAQRDNWTELVLGIEALLPLSRHVAGSLTNLASYLYDRTGGSIGSLRGLLTDAAIGAILTGHERVDRPTLDATATDRAAEEFSGNDPDDSPR